MLIIVMSLATQKLAVDSPLFVQGIVILFLTIGMIVRSILIAAGVNEEYSTHAHLLSMNALTMTTHLAENLSNLRDARIQHEKRTV